MLRPSVQIHNDNGILLAEFWDCLRLDPLPIQQLRNRYETHLRDGGRADLVIDLSGVAFAGSAALGNFVALQRLSRQNGGRLVFCHVDPTVLEVFRATKLEPLFEFVADRAAALKSIARGPIANTADHPLDLGGRPDQVRSAGNGQSGFSRLRRRKPQSDSA
jgi:anti-anti-sigma factor